MLVPGPGPQRKAGGRWEAWRALEESQRVDESDDDGDIDNPDIAFGGQRGRRLQGDVDVGG